MSQDNPIEGQAETSSDVPASDIQVPNPKTVRVLLVVGAAVVIGTVIKRLNNPETIPQKPGFGQSEISIPAGAELMGVENGDARIVLRLKDKDGPLLILLDPRKGTEKGRVRLNRE